MQNIAIEVVQNGYMVREYIAPGKDPLGQCVRRVAQPVSPRLVERPYYARVERFKATEARFARNDGLDLRNIFDVYTANLMARDSFVHLHLHL